MRFLVVVLLIIAATTAKTRTVVGTGVAEGDDDAMATRGGACSATDADGASCVGAYPSVVNHNDNDDDDDNDNQYDLVLQAERGFARPRMVLSLVCTNFYW